MQRCCIHIYERETSDLHGLPRDDAGRPARRRDDGSVLHPAFRQRREPNEYQINRIPGSELIPLGDIPKRYTELDPNEEIVVQCKMGGRSAKAADFLRSVGFKHVLNLKGGILDWVDKVDPSQPKY